MWKKIIVALILVLIVLVAAWQYLKPAPPVIVSAIEPTVETLSTKLDLNAVVINSQTVTITALLNGEIKRIDARQGNTVERLQSLAVLDSQQAQSLLDKAQAELAHSKQKVRSASRAYARIKNLSKAGNASTQSLDDGLDAVRTAEAERTVASANVKLAELRLKNASISAPFAGVVTEQYVETGQWVEAGTPLFKLVASDGYLIEAQVDASDWAKVYLQQRVALTTESAPGVTWQSQVSWIAPRVATNNRDAKAVAIRFPYGDDAPALLLGQEVDAQLVLAQATDVLSLPLSAMIETEPGEFAVFVAQNNKAKLTPVSVGLQNATHAEITGGITQSDTIVSSLHTPLTDNISIEIR